jgi:hypothetical protein
VVADATREDRRRAPVSLPMAVLEQEGPGEQW